MSSLIVRLAATCLIAVLLLPLADIGKAALAQSDELAPPEPQSRYGGSGCMDVGFSDLPMCQKWFREIEEWKARQAAKIEAARRATGEVKTQPGDTGLPLLRVQAPSETEVGTIRITGLVGDDGSPPRLTVDGARVPLFRPDPNAEKIATHTLAFDMDVPAEKAGEKRIVLEACDAAGNCVAERIVVRVVASKAAPAPATQTVTSVAADRTAELVKIEAAEVQDPRPTQQGSASCNTVGAEYASACVLLRKDLKAWKQRQAEREEMKRELTATAPRKTASLSRERTAELAKIEAEAVADRLAPPQPPNATSKWVDVDECSTPLCQKWFKAVEDWKARRVAREEAKRKLVAVSAPRTAADAQKARAELRRVAAQRQQREGEARRTRNELEARTAELESERGEADRLRKELEAARRESERLVAEQKAAAEAARGERERVAAERKAAGEQSRKLAETRAREDARKAGEARDEETERLRKELEAARRESERLVAERKAAAETARREREQLAAERKIAEAKARKLARERAQAEERRLAEGRARAAEAAKSKESAEDAQLAALVRKLQESNLLARPRDTGLPIIRSTLPKRIEVGDTVRVAGLVGDEGSPPRLKLNGSPMPLYKLKPGQKPLARHTLAFRFDVDTGEVGQRRYTLEACDADGNCFAEDIALTVVAANRPSLAARNFALVIGNNRYRDLPDLKTAVADAQAVAEVLTTRYAFKNENVKLLLNADRVSMLRSLSALRRQLQPDDRLLIYYAGHGQIDDVTEEGFWQPVDALPGEEYSWIANSDVRRQLRGMPAKHVLVIADSCFSGSLTRGTEEYVGVPKERFYTEIDRPVSRKMISSGGTEPVADSGTGGHSVFAYYLLKALRENNKPYFASFELFGKLARAVTNNSSQKPQYGTVSEAGDEGSGDFTFILKQGG